MHTRGDAPGPAPSDLGQMSQVAKISLYIGLFSALGILLMALYVDTPNQDYLLSISSLVATSERLDLLMLLTGCCLVGACAAVTWSISVYNSLNVAGPLFRFSQNLQFDQDGNPVKLIKIRGTDYLQNEYQLLSDSMQHLYGHYEQIEDQLVSLREAIRDGDEAVAQELINQIEALIKDVAIDA